MYIAVKGEPIANLQEDLAADIATLKVQCKNRKTNNEQLFTNDSNRAIL